MVWRFQALASATKNAMKLAPHRNKSRTIKELKDIYPLKAAPLLRRNIQIQRRIVRGTGQAANGPHLDFLIKPC